jgi:hypothetical protein
MPKFNVDSSMEASTFSSFYNYSPSTFVLNQHNVFRLRGSNQFKYNDNLYWTSIALTVVTLTLLPLFLMVLLTLLAFKLKICQNLFTKASFSVKFILFFSFSLYFCGACFFFYGNYQMLLSLRDLGDIRQRIVRDLDNLRNLTLSLEEGAYQQSDYKFKVPCISLFTKFIALLRKSINKIGKISRTNGMKVLEYRQTLVYYTDVTVKMINILKTIHGP